MCVFQEEVDRLWSVVLRQENSWLDATYPDISADGADGAWVIVRNTLSACPVWRAIPVGVCVCVMLLLLLLVVVVERLMSRRSWYLVSVLFLQSPPSPVIAPLPAPDQPSIDVVEGDGEGGSSSSWVLGFGGALGEAARRRLVEEWFQRQREEESEREAKENREPKTEEGVEVSIVET